ncbi:MAG: STAS domain-containing protein [Porcipelethomonas sp.]
MIINKEINGKIMTVSLSGRLDASTAPQLEAEFKDSLEGISDLTIDMSWIEYISSAGLRVLLSANKLMSNQGVMLIKNVSSDIMEIFELTGFDSILNIE